MQAFHRYILAPEWNERRFTQQFHTLTLSEVMEHLDDPRSLLKELATLLLPGGILVLEAPNCEGGDRHLNLKEYRKIDPLEHINGFTPTTLRRLAESLGFKRIQPPRCIRHDRAGTRRPESCQACPGPGAEGQHAAILSQDHWGRFRFVTCEPVSGETPQQVPQVLRAGAEGESAALSSRSGTTTLPPVPVSVETNQRSVASA